MVASFSAVMSRLLVMAHFEVASCNIFPDNRQEIIRYAEVGDGAGGINVICGRPEVTDDVISSYNVETFRDYHAAIL